MGGSPDWVLEESMEVEQKAGPSREGLKSKVLGTPKKGTVGPKPSLTPIRCQKAPVPKGVAQEEPEPMEFSGPKDLEWLFDDGLAGPGMEEAPQTVTSAGDEAARSLHRRHDHSGDKYRFWDLTLERPILFLGDSNLGRLPQVENSKVEVDF